MFRNEDLEISLNSTRSEGTLMRRDLRNSCLEGSCHSLMVGLAETWFAAFFIAANISNFSIGMLATLPLLTGSLLQLGTPWGIRWMGSYRVWSVAGSVVQGASLVALGILSGLDAVTFEFAFLALVFYWGSSLAIGPAWNTWMEFVIPKRVRTKYLSSRMRVCQICLLIAVCVAGLVLHSNSIQARQEIFSVLFFAAGLFRLVSAALLYTHREHRMWKQASFAGVSETQLGEDFGRTVREVVPFFVAIQFSVFISGPFFAPFMLRSMGMNYAAFMSLIVLGYLGRILTLHFASKVAQSRGPGSLLLWGAVGIAPLSGLWWFYESFLFLAIVQLLGGVAWGCYELAMSIVFMEQIPRQIRPRVLAIFGLFNGIAMVTGSLLGGVILHWFENQVSGFMIVFIASSVIRAASLLLFPYGLFAERAANPTLLPESFVPATPQLNGRPEINGYNLSSMDEAPVLASAETATTTIAFAAPPDPGEVRPLRKSA
jgi:hypothetical protein